MEPTIDRAIKAVMAGTFEPIDYGQFSYMSYGGASLAPLDPKLVPQDVADAVKGQGEGESSRGCSGSM